MHAFSFLYDGFHLLEFQSGWRGLHLTEYGNFARMMTADWTDETKRSIVITAFENEAHDIFAQMDVTPPLDYDYFEQGYDRPTCDFTAEIVAQSRRKQRSPLPNS